METALADHNRLIDALQARNASAAARLSSKHVNRSRTHVLEGLSRRAVVA